MQSILGVLLNSKLNFNKHIDNIWGKANSVLALLKRNLYHCNTQVRGQAYILYVRPMLEYASTVWAPYTKSNIEKLESVQQRAARFVVYNYDFSSCITSILNTLKIPDIHKFSFFSAYQFQLFPRSISKICC